MRLSGWMCSALFTIVAAKLSLPPELSSLLYSKTKLHTSERHTGLSKPTAKRKKPLPLPLQTKCESAPMTTVTVTIGKPATPSNIKRQTTEPADIRVTSRQIYSILKPIVSVGIVRPSIFMGQLLPGTFALAFNEVARVTHWTYKLSKYIVNMAFKSWKLFRPVFVLFSVAFHVLLAPFLLLMVPTNWAIQIWLALFPFWIAMASAIAVGCGVGSVAGVLTSPVVEKWIDTFVEKKEASIIAHDTEPHDIKWGTYTRSL